MPAVSFDRVIGPDFDRRIGKEAWEENLRLTAMAASKIQSSLGPMGAYKMIHYHRGPELVVKVTKDGAEIMDELAVQYPLAKVISEAAKIQREHVGDGVSSFIIFLAGLLRGAEKLKAAGVHPNVILRGYQEAAKKAAAVIDEEAVRCDESVFNSMLRVVDCGRGFMTEKVNGLALEAADLATKDGKVDVKLIRYAKQSGGTPNDSELIRGVIVKKGKAHGNMPDLVEEPRIALVAKQLDIKPLDIKLPKECTFQYKLEITDASQLSKFKDEELRLKMEMVARLKSLGANVVMSRSPIADVILSALAKEEMFAAMSLSQEDIDAVAEATGGKVASELKELTEGDLGRADNLEVRKIEEEEIFTLHSKRGVTMLLRSSSPEDLSEFERVLRNSFLLLKHAKNGGKYVPGGGAIEASVALELRKFALSFDGREQVSIDSFADALEEIPQCLARNYGLDPSDAIVALKANHAEGRKAIGLSRDGCSNMLDAGVLELAATSKTMIERAVEVASLMLGIDDYVFKKELPVFHKQ